MASVTLGVGGVAGAVGLTAGTAGAAPTTVQTAKVAATSTTVAIVGTTQAGGTVTITFPAGAMATSTLHVAVANTPAGGTVDFQRTPTVTGTNIHATVTPLVVPATAITIALTGKVTAATATVKISGITYETTGVSGVSKDVVVTPTITAGDTTVTFTPATVSNAKYPAPVVSTPNSVELFNLTNRPEPPVGVGATGATAGNWTLTLRGKSTSVKPEGVGKGSYVTITIAPHTGINSCTATNAVAFDGTPKVTVTTRTTVHVSATPKFTVTEKGTATGCSTKFAPNKLQITFTSTVSFGTTTTAAIVLNITTVKYSTAFKTTPGTVTVSDKYFRFAGATGTNLVTGTADDATLGVTSTNAIVAKAYVLADTKTTTIPANAYNHSITPIKVVESVAGSVPKGYVCISIADSQRFTIPQGPSGWKSTTNYTPSTVGPNFFNTGSKGTLTVTSGNGVASTLHFVGAKGSTASVVAFKVTTASTTASTYSVSGLSVNSDVTDTVPPLVTVYYASTATCGFTPGNGPTDNLAIAYTTTPSTAQIYGATADATAAAELQSRFSGNGDFGSCPGLTGTNVRTTSLGQRPVVLARDSGYPDALASQYLAQYLNTGTLLTPTLSLSTVTLAAIRHEGITEVYVTGGPLAVSTTVVATLESTPVYHCGGRNLQTTATGAPEYIQVQRIYGATAYATAADIATYVPTTHVESLNLAGAYTGTNATKGNGMYNATSGSASSAPTVTGAQRTAIMATGTTFQDAESGSALAYSQSLPIVLTTPTGLSPEAKTALYSLNISQVIVLGGPLAVDNTVVTALEGMGISVLRVAGKTYSQTADMLANLETNSTTGHLGLGWVSHDVLVARGTGFTDGIAGAVLDHTGNRLGTGGDSHEGTMPLLLTLSPTQVGSALTAFLKSVGEAGTGFNGTRGNEVSTLTILGGPLAVTPAVVTQMETDIGH